MSARRTILVAMMLGAGLSFAQLRPRPGVNPRSGVAGHFVRIEGGLVVNEDEIRTARETDSHSSGTPNWTNAPGFERSEEHTSELQSLRHLVCRLLLEKKKKKQNKAESN